MTTYVKFVLTVNWFAWLVVFLVSLITEQHFVILISALSLIIATHLCTMEEDR